MSVQTAPAIYPWHRISLRMLPVPRPVKILIPLLFTFLLCGCETNDIMAWNRNSKDEQSVVRDPGCPPLANIEFGDQGDLKPTGDPTNQVDVAKALIKKMSKPLLVVYVHGWFSDAKDSYDEKNPIRVKTILKALSTSPFIQKQHYQVVGVYVAWRAKTANFWRAYDTAKRIGDQLDCVDAISDVIRTARQQSPQAKTFLIGHSFGGLILQQAIEKSVVNAKEQGETYAPADLTLFLNPASASETARETIARLQDAVSVQNSKGDPGRFPVFAVLSSETDDPNKVLFPIGKFLSKPFDLGFDQYPVEGGKTVSGHYFYTHTPGNNPYLLTHRTNNPIPTTPAHSADNAFEENLQTQIDPDRPSFKTRSDNGQWLQWNLEPVRSETVKTPYWIVQVDKRIMNGHNDVTNPNALALMAALYRLNHQFIAAQGLGPVKLQKKATGPHRVFLQSAEKTEQATQRAIRATPANPPAPVPNN